MFVIAARVVLTAVFVVSGLAKLADRPGTVRSLRDFGVPIRLVRTGAVVLPVTELGVAGLLATPPTAWWGGLAALVLLATFSAAVAAQLGQGRRPDCHCFGRLHHEPVSGRLLARNGVLGALAVVVVLAA